MNREQRTWPHLVGKDGKEAVEIIKRDTGKIIINSYSYFKVFSLSAGFTDVHLVPPDSMVTTDYRTDRVRIYVDERGKVVYPPNVA